MQRIKMVSKAFVFIILTGIGLKHNTLIASQNCIQDHYKILFIGSSYFNFNDLPGLLRNFTDSSGKEITIDRQITNGLYLGDHANSSATAAKINEKDWDYVVLQGVGTLVAYPEVFTHHPVYSALISLRDKINTNCESTKIVFCLPWAFEDGMTWMEGWTDSYDDMQNHIYENTLSYSDDVGFVIAPVGSAWQTVLREMNYPLHYLHMSDWNHPSLKGSYLMACVIYSTIFLKSTVGNPYSGGLPEDEANYFQTVATNTVLDSLALWNITTIDADTSGPLLPNEFCLHQNYPNPFNPVTKIRYNLPEDNFVTLTIYDVRGQVRAIPVQEFQYAGCHEISFDATQFQSGIYLYRLKMKNHIETRKCLYIQ